MFLCVKLCSSASSGHAYQLMHEAVLMANTPTAFIICNHIFIIGQK